MTIRELTTDDIPQVIELGRAMHLESQYRGLTFSAVKAAQACEHTIDRDTEVGLVGEEAGELYGMLAAFVAEYEYGHERIAYDRLVYVVPSHRGGTLAVRMIKRYEEWAKSMKAEQIHLGQTTDVHPWMVDAFYRRLGYEWVGGCYRKET